MSTYFQHGRRHGVGGTDPIPGLSGLSWAYLSAYGSHTIAGTSTTTYISAQDVTNANFFTNDPDTFSNGFHTISGTDTYGITVSQGGTFALFQDGVWASGTSATALLENYRDIFDAGGFSSSTSLIQWGRVSCLGNDLWDKNFNSPHTSYFELIDFPDAGISIDSVSGFPAIPSTVVMWGRNAGPNSGTLGSALFIVKLGSGFYNSSNWN